MVNPNEVRIICEGRTDKNNLKNLINHMNEEEHLKFNVTDNSFIVMGNKSYLLDDKSAGYCTLLNQVKLNIVTKLLFIVDADDVKDNATSGGFINTQQKIGDLITSLNIAGISDYFIACDPNTKTGYFESLLLSTVDKELKKCYEEFLNCSKLTAKDNQKTIMEELHRLTKPDKPYDFSHPNFDELKRKLKNLLS